MSAKPTAAPEQPSSNNPLVDQSVVQSLINMRAYAAYLSSCIANDSGAESTETLQQGQFLAMSVLVDALDVVVGGAAEDDIRRRA